MVPLLHVTRQVPLNPADLVDELLGFAQMHTVQYKVLMDLARARYANVT
jgi:hypothetical protein